MKQVPYVLLFVHGERHLGRKKATAALCGGLLMAIGAGMSISLSTYSLGQEIPFSVFWYVAIFIAGVLLMVEAVRIMKTN